MSKFSSLDGGDPHQWIHRYSNVSAEPAGIMRERGREETSVKFLCSLLIVLFFPSYIMLLHM